MPTGSKNAPEARAREKIDRLLEEAGWTVQDRDEMNISLPAVAVREFTLERGHGFADYLLFLDGKAIGVCEAKPAGFLVRNVEVQTKKYVDGLPSVLDAPFKPLPFAYISTGEETAFINHFDPHPRTREVFSFHRPETLREWLSADTLDAWIKLSGGSYTSADDANPSTLRARFRAMPPVVLPGMWPNKVTAVVNIEKSLFDDHPRSLIQMATGTGKTLLAVTTLYRLIKFGGARRVLFLVDRANLGEQAEKEFQSFRTPDDNRKFVELYGVQRLTSNTIGSSSKVVISTIQRLYSILKGEPELDPGLEEHTALDDGSELRKAPLPVVYNKAIPPEYFDIIFIDECHRSIYSLWRQVLEYFDAHLLGLTATPAQHTYGFFNQNVVLEYPHEQAVVDGVTVPVYGSSGVVGYHNRALTRGPTIIVGRKGNVGQPHLSPASCWPIDTAYFNEGVAGADLRFFFYLLEHKALRRLDRSTAIPGLSRDDYDAVSIEIPGDDEQRRILGAVDSYLSRLDAAAATLETVQRKVTAYRASVLKAAVEGRLVPAEAALARAEKRDFEPADVLLRRILSERRRRWEKAELAKMKAAGKSPKDDKWKAKYEEPEAPKTKDLPSLPQGWCWATWAQLSVRVTVGHVGSMKDEYVDNGIPFLRSQNVRENRFDPEGLKYIATSFHEKLAKSALEPGDVLIVRSGAVGTACVLPDAIAVANCSDLVIVKTPLLVIPQFGAYYMNSLAKASVRAQQVGIALTHFNTASAAALPIPVPPLAEQERIVAEVEKQISVESEAAIQVERDVVRVGRLRQAVLKWAFEGKLVDQDPNDEPAEKLLERIRAERAATATPKRPRRARAAE